MVNLRFSDKEIRDLVGSPFAITFLFYPFPEVKGKWDPYDDSLVYSDYSGVLFDFLLDLKIESCISPLHCYDEDPDISTKFKDPHFHVVITLGSGGKKSVRQWFELIDPIRDFVSIAPFDKGESSLEDCCKVFNKKNKVQKMRTLLRYFYHADNPEKYQYDSADLKTFGGLDLNNMLYSQTDDLQLLREIKKYVKDKHIYNFADLVDYCDDVNTEWFHVLTRSNMSNFIFQYQRSSIFRDTGAQDRQYYKYLDYANDDD